MGQSHLPHERFNLFHIDNLEIHLESLTVSAFLHDIDPSNPPTKESDQKLENISLLKNGVLHINSRSMVFDQDTKETLPDLAKFRFNSKFDFERISGDQLEQVHS